MVLLTKEDPYTFSLYLELVYRGSLSLEQAGTAEYDAITVAKNYLVLADIYVLADFLVDPSTKNIVVDTMLAYARVNRQPCAWSGQYHLPEIEVINAIYANTMEGDGARKLLIELHDANDVKLADVHEWKDISPEFVQELTMLRRATGYEEDPVRVVSSRRGTTIRFRTTRVEFIEIVRVKMGKTPTKITTWKMKTRRMKTT
jgi:hypothetical protein